MRVELIGSLFLYSIIGGVSLNITLLKNGQKKTYSQLFVSARFMRKALELRTEMNLNNLSVEDIDTSINFVVELFGNQFTADDVYEGVSYDELISTVFDNVFMVVLQGRKQELESSDGEGKK